MAIKFQYNKTSLGELGKQLKMRQKALPTIKSKESALRSEVKKAKDSAADYRRRLEALKGGVRLHGCAVGEFDSDLLRISDVDLGVRKIAGVRIPEAWRMSVSRRRATTCSPLRRGSPTASISSSAWHAWGWSSRSTTVGWSCWTLRGGRRRRR